MCVGPGFTVERLVREGDGRRGRGVCSIRGSSRFASWGSYVVRRCGRNSALIKRGSWYISIHTAPGRVVYLPEHILSSRADEIECF